MFETALLYKRSRLSSLLSMGIVPSTTARTLSLGLTRAACKWYTDLPGSVPVRINGSDAAYTKIDIQVPANAKFIYFTDFEKRLAGSYLGTASGVPNSIIKTVEQWDDYPLDRIWLRESNELTQVPKTLFASCGMLVNAFQLCPKFNSDVSSWDVSNVTRFDYVFANTNVFNSSVENWQIRPDALILGMLRTAVGFNQPMNNFNIGNNTTLNSFFYGNTLFNQPLDKWDISKIRDIGNFLGHCSNFNQDLSGWVFAAGTEKTYYDNGATKWIPSYKPKFL